MKTTGKKLCVKVDAKQIVTENNKEYVRIKRKVIKRISRKSLKDPKNDYKVAKTSLFRHFLQKIIGCSDPEDFPSANNTQLKQHQSFLESADSGTSQNLHFPGFENIQSDSLISSDLHLPLQF